MTRNTIIPYRKDLKTKARALRKDSTFSEVLPWQEIRKKQIEGYQFHRQVPILDYIVDFYCHELKLALEVNGNSHEHKVNYDEKRRQRLQKQGVTVLDIDDLDVKRDLNRVLNEIVLSIHELE